MSAPAAAEKIAGTDLGAAELVTGLPWAFEVETQPSEPGGCKEPLSTRRHRFKSTGPIATAPGDVYLRAELTTYEYGDAPTASAALTELLASADPDMGLSYAWDRVLQSGAFVYRLNAECTFSEETFQRMAGRLEAAVRARPPSDPQIVSCRCGGGCYEQSGSTE